MYVVERLCCGFALCSLVCKHGTQTKEIKMTGEDISLQMSDRSDVTNPTKHVWAGDIVWLQ